MKKLFPILICITGLILAQYEAQEHVPSDERGDPNYRRMTNIDVNLVRTSIFNYGVTGRPGTDSPLYVPYEWPVNSGQHYIAMTSLCVGGRVLMEEGDWRPLVTITHRSDDSGNSKAWEPVPGYLNPNSTKIAISDDLSTWPTTWPDKMEDENDAGWPGSWNGYFGKNKFSAEQEIYYKVSDDRNYRQGYTYFPDSTDFTRQGIALNTGVRVMEWKQILIEDDVFILHDIKNDGTKDIPKVSFSMWLADLVGGDGDTSDDSPDFDLIYDIAWSMDSDGIGNSAFGPGETVGVAATSFIETPGNNVDGIDNDADGEDNGPLVSREMACGLDLLCPGDVEYMDVPDAGEEDLTNSIDDNRNGLVDENLTHIPFENSAGVTFRDGIDNDNDSPEGVAPGCPMVTEEMILSAEQDMVMLDGYPLLWHRWPPDCESDSFQDSIIHLISVDEADLGLPYADNIDNDGNPDAPYANEYPYGTGIDVNSPVVTQEMIDEAANDPYRRYRVPGTDIILYDVEINDLGKSYADGVDNDNDGAIDEGIDEGIDEMIDESRDDFIDNDGDWTTADDMGLFGDGSGGMAVGASDLNPTSGSGTGFPGEPNIDKTDVSESDQMGLTAVSYDEAGSIPTNFSEPLWNNYMTPGEFWQRPEGSFSGDYDLFVTSGFFPLKAGQTERISMAVCLGANEQDAVRNKNVAQTTYDFDYQFAKAPLAPQVTAVASDGRVTLYWDRTSEYSEDNYMKKITNGRIQYDFEGYKIYRATDWEFSDAYNITDATGTATFFEPYMQGGQTAQWDLIDEHSGFHPVDLNGVMFNLGSNTGLVHSYVDSNVVNGQTYYYAVVAYDYGGDTSNNIMPSDSPMRLRVSTLDGSLELGSNVVEVTPNAPAAGYVDANDLIEVDHIQGASSGNVYYEVINPLNVKDGHRYHITFTDTVFANQQGISGYDTLTTRHWFLTDVTDITDPDTLVQPTYWYYEYADTIYQQGQPVPIIAIDSTLVNPLPETNDMDIIDGFRLWFQNIDFLALDQEASFWNRNEIYPFNVRRYDYEPTYIYGTPLPYNYRVIFTDAPDFECECFCKQPATLVNDGQHPYIPVGESVLADPCDQDNPTLEFDYFGIPIVLEVYNNPEYCLSTLYQGGPVYFKVQRRNTYTGDESFDWVDIPFAFGDFTPNLAEPDGIFSRTPENDDRIVFLDHTDADGEMSPSWYFYLRNPEPNEVEMIDPVPVAGDTASVYIEKPFMGNDVYEFIAEAPYIDRGMAKGDLDNVYVVPNPYFAAVPWEPMNPFDTGRGPREIQFRNLPAQCDIRIYTVSGELVRKIKHESAITDGSASWDLLTKDNLSAAYGIYIFHVDAPGIGEYVGKFAIVK